MDHALAHLHEIPVPGSAERHADAPALVSERAPDFVQKVTAVMMAGKGDLLPVSAFPVDGTWPVGTAKWEKRNLALEIPVWDPKVCIQCNQCALVCPHAAIRAKVYEPAALAGRTIYFQVNGLQGQRIQGQNCSRFRWRRKTAPAATFALTSARPKTGPIPKHKAINMEPQAPLRDAERDNYDFFLDLPEMDRDRRRAAGPQGLAVPRAAV